MLNSPAHPCRYRRFACPLTGANARLAEKRGSVTPSFRGTCTPYLLPVRLAHQTLDAHTIIPGHALPTTGAALGRYLAYLNDLVGEMRGARLRGDTLEQALSGYALPAAYVIPADSPLAAFGEFNNALHRWNLRVTYGELAGD